TPTNGAATGGSAGGLLRLLERLQHRFGDVTEDVELLGGQYVDEVAADLRDVARRGGLDRRPTLRGERHERAPTIGGALAALQQSALLHPPELVREAAPLPLQGAGELEIGRASCRGRAESAAAAV